LGRSWELNKGLTTLRRTHVRFTAGWDSKACHGKPSLASTSVGWGHALLLKRMRELECCEGL
jgi:hypothetical protein